MAEREGEKEQELKARVEMMAARRELRQRRRGDAIEAKQEADRVAVACACERGRRVQIELLASAARWEGYNPGEVQFWDQSRPVDASVECTGIVRGCCRAREAFASGTCGGTWAWREGLRLRRAREAREGLRRRSSGVMPLSVADGGIFADGVLLFMIWYSFQCHEVLMQEQRRCDESLQWRAVVLEMCGKRARVVQGRRMRCVRRSPGCGCNRRQRCSATVSVRGPLYGVEEAVMGSVIQAGCGTEVVNKRA